MATHCSVLAWRIPGTAEPGELPSMGSHRVWHDWSDLAASLTNSPKMQVILTIAIVVVQSLSPVWLSATPWTAAHQASLSSTISQSLLKFASIESVMLCNHYILCWPFPFCLQSSPASGSFPMSWLFPLGGWSIGASASVLPMNSQSLLALGLTGLISLLSKGLSRVQPHSSKA